MKTSKEKLSKLKDKDFFQLAKTESTPKMRIRLLTLRHLREGKTKSEVIDMLQIVFPTSHEWLLRFNEKGVEGLREKPGKGRKKVVY